MAIELPASSARERSSTRRRARPPEMVAIKRGLPYALKVNAGRRHGCKTASTCRVLCVSAFQRLEERWCGVAQQRMRRDKVIHVSESVERNGSGQNEFPVTAGCYTIFHICRVYTLEQRTHSAQPRQKMTIQIRQQHHRPCAWLLPATTSHIDTRQTLDMALPPSAAPRRPVARSSLVRRQRPLPECSRRCSLRSPALLQRQQASCCAPA